MRCAYSNPCRYPWCREFSSNLSGKRVMSRRKFILSWLNIMGQDILLFYPILISAIRCDSFAWGEKVLQIRNTAEDDQISKFISESRGHSKHRPMLQFETLLRLPTLLRQRYSVSSLKFFIWNFVAGDRSPQIERRSETNKSITCSFAAGRVWEGTAEELDGVLHWWWVLGSMEEFPETMLLKSGRGAPRTGSSNDRGREINVDCFFNPSSFIVVDLLSQENNFMHNTSLIRYWSQ
jgi:hypothetical protein